MKTRILVLHGFCDNAQNRQNQMRTLIRTMKDVDFVFINSPFPFVNLGFLKESDDIVKEDSEQRYQWFSYQSDWPVNHYSYDTLKESTTFVIDYIKQSGPFQGLLGFSQGAIVCVAAMLNIEGIPTLPDCVKFSVVIGCPAINDVTVKKALQVFDKTKGILSLHVSGMNDTLIPTAMSKDVFQYFDSTKTKFHIHKGGHYCPSDSDFRQSLRDLIKHAIIT